MPLVPSPFLFRVAYQCRYVRGIPREDGERLLDLSAAYRIDNFADMQERGNFAELRLAWNEFGVAVQAERKREEQEPQCNAQRLKSSDGLTLWIDTRDARTSHRASRYCHQFHFLPCGGGQEGDEPVVGQTKINRALQDAPFCNPNEVPFRCQRIKKGYV